MRGSRRPSVGAAALLLLVLAGPLQADDLAQFRDLYRDLVETDTTFSSGNCTAAAEKMAERLRDAGLPESDVRVVVAPEHPREGNLVAVLRAPGKPRDKGVLLLAHIDVVEARREDWTRDPFRLAEEDGYYHGRGVADDKAMAAIWVDILIRLHRDATFRPRRDIRIALTCGEETLEALDGIQYLLANHRELVDAGFALNEGGYGVLDAQGRRVMMNLHVGEKTPQDFRLEVLNPGGHSARPVPDNAIYRLATALTRLERFQFPIQFNDTTRAYFAGLAKLRGGEAGAAIQVLLADPADEAASRAVTADPTWNAMLRSTCVATMLDAGHATNALPQRAAANVNCRLFPGTTVEEARRTLVAVVADPAIRITAAPSRMPLATPTKIDAFVLRAIEAHVAEFFPGVPLLLTQGSGYTDSPFLNAAGIPAYGLGLFLDPDFGHIHGADERVRVQSVHEARDFLSALVRHFASERR